jgi:hypothetical protein
VAGCWDLIMTGVPGGGPEPTKSTTPNAGRSRRPRPARRTGPKRATGLNTGHGSKGQDRDPEHLIAVNRKKPARMGRAPPPITHHGARSL